MAAALSFSKRCQASLPVSKSQTWPIGLRRAILAVATHFPSGEGARQFSIDRNGKSITFVPVDVSHNAIAGMSWTNCCVPPPTTRDLPFEEKQKLLVPWPLGTLLICVPWALL